MKTKHIAVLGAGFVGICSAIALIKRGYTVSLIDKSTPASETSHGNSGVIWSGGFHPLADPQLIKELPRLACNQDTKFLLQYSELPWLAPWLIRFLNRCQKKHYVHSTAAVGALSKDSVSHHLALMKEANAESYLNETGYLRVFRHEQTFESARKQFADFDDHDIPYTIVTGSEIADLEPDLDVDYAGAIWMNGSHSVKNPGQLGRRYFDYFISLGGKFYQQPAKALETSSTPAGWKVTLDNQQIECDAVVMAMGVWSNELLKPFGIKLPFVQERGYHMMFQYPGDKTLSRPVNDAEMGFVLSPMDYGIRATTGCNLSARERAPNPRQLKKLLPYMRQTFSLGDEILDQPWMGRRISTPDSIPLIGELPKLPGLVIATGHCHLGLTLAPVTGECIADIISSSGNRDLTPYDPLRFA